MELTVFTRDGLRYDRYVSVEEFLSLWTGYRAEDVAFVLHHF